jgi:hypothetical protein
MEGYCPKCERNILQRSKQSKSTSSDRAMSRARSTISGLSSVKDNQTHRADLQLLLCKMTSDGGARVPTSDQQKRRRCVGGRSNKSTHSSQKRHPESERFVWREAQGNKKGFASQDRLEKGPRAAIGKKRADGQRCSHVSLLLGRGPIKEAEQTVGEARHAFLLQRWVRRGSGDGIETRR